MRLLNQFASTFLNKLYKHRASTQGDLIAAEIYEDLFALGKSSQLINRIHSHDRVINLRNKTVGRNKSRRGDGTFGELVPGSPAAAEAGFKVARGHTANIEIGVETKILANSMIKQIDRVIGDLQRQSSIFKAQHPDAICVALVGINFSDRYVSYEKDRVYPTDGKGKKHPYQEATKAQGRILDEAASHFDELLILPFRATNIEPFPFSWVDENNVQLEYNAMLTRISRLYDGRFR